MLSIKLIVTDMDGTLLNGNIEMTDRAAEAVYRAQEAGLEFAVATGRTVQSGYSIVKKKGITCPFIELNGARMFDEKEKLQFTRAIGRDETKLLIDIIEKYGIHNEFITEDATFSNKSMEDYLEAFQAVFKDINRSLSEEDFLKMMQERFQDIDVQTVDDYNFLYQDPNIQVLKLLVNAVEDVSV